jgi:hypothetical protein
MENPAPHVLKNLGGAAGDRSPEDYSTGFITDCAHFQGMSDDVKKREKLESRGQQDENLSKGAESERERSTKRPGTGA